MATIPLLSCLVIVGVTLTLADVPCTSPTVPASVCDCIIRTNGQRFLNCKDKGLTSIPTFTPTSDIFDEIDFSYYVVALAESNRITFLPANAFQNITAKKINLLTNPIGNIALHAFLDDRPRNNLQTLYLQGNSTNQPPTDQISILTQLVDLHLQSYTKTRLQSGDFPFPNLITLKLIDFKRTSSIESFAFSPLTKLKALHIEKMPDMTTLPVEALNAVWRLEELHLKDLHLTAIYGQTFNSFINLKYLYLHYNEVELSIQNNAFGGSANSLTHLYLQYNELTSLNFLSAQNFPNLTHLDLSNNYELYQELNATTFARLSALRTLMLQDIGLTNVRQTMFTGISRMHTLDISYNYIGTIETAAFSLMPELTELRLARQTVGSTQSTLILQTNAFQGIGSLQHLLLEANKINFAQFWPLLESLPNLLELNLDETELQTISDYAFRYNTKLHTLSLRQNNISSINQRTFFGPRYTLQSLDLALNKLQTIDACVFSDFPTKPKFYFTNNSLACDCNLVWLYDWVLTQQADAVLYYVGTCSSPPNLHDLHMVRNFTKDVMCPSNSNPVPNCPDLYSTTTSSTTTSTTTQTPTPTPRPKPPVPAFSFIVNQPGENFIELSWTVTDKTDVTGYVITMVSNYQPTVTRSIAKEESSQRFHDLRSGETFYFCLALKIEGELRDSDRKCVSANTLVPVTTTSSNTPTTAAPQANIGLIAGLAGGGVVLVILVVVIVYLLLRSNKQRKAPTTTPVSFTMHPHANIPQAGGTAKRFAKKPDKEGASPDDINISVVSNGAMNNPDRISAGSYQFLNEKGVDHSPMPSGSKDTGPDHYMNSLDNRPLPRAPGGAKGRGYVNTGYKNSREHLPETSKNNYYEVRY